MIYAKGAVVKFEPTVAGRRRASELREKFPLATGAVLKAPHHVELLCDFVFQPLDEAKRPAKVIPIGAVAILIAVLFLMFWGSPSGVAAGVVDLGGSAVVVGSTPAASLLLAEISPQDIGASANVGMYWVGALLVILQVMQFFKPAPPLHKQYADKEEIKEQLREIKEDLEKWSKDHYVARSRMYRRINALENALSFMVGKMARQNDPDAERMERLLEKANDQGGEEG